MNEPYHTPYGRLGAALLLLLIAFIVHSCRKNNAADNKQITPEVNAAKAWYENTYHTPQRGLLKNMDAAGQTTNGDFSQVVKPDWSKAINYSRLNTNVIEIPFDTAVQLGFAFQNNGVNSYSFNKSLSKSTFLIFGNENSYQAYIMTIIADTSYIKNDYIKLNTLSYRYKDNDFSGSVLYFTPKGKLVSGWYYKAGKIIRSITAGAGSSNGLSVQGTICQN